MGRTWWLSGVTLLLACGSAVEPDAIAVRAAEDRTSSAVVAPAAKKVKECTKRDLRADPGFCDSRVDYATATACVKFQCVATSCQAGLVLVDGRCECPAGFELVDGACLCPVGSKLVEGACSSRCVTVGALQWCHDPDVQTGESCTALCGDLRMTVLADTTAWFEAQDTESECAGLRDAFGLSLPVELAGFTYACATYWDDSDYQSFSCSYYDGCPANHTTGSDSGGVQVCPCVSP